MDKAHQLIVNVKVLGMPRIAIETNAGKRFTSDLSKFKSVYCFPPSQSEWNNVSITTGGHSLTWTTRFEVHVDQVIDAAESVEDLKKRA